MGGGGQISGTGFARKATLDKLTRAATTIDDAHHQIHAGDSFMCFVTDLALGANERHIISFKTPNTTKYCHLVSTASVTGEAEFEMYEDVTITDNTGTTLVVYNRNRNSGTTSGILDTGQNPDLVNRATLDADIGSGSAYGTILEHVGMGAETYVAGTHRSMEWILRPNINYAFAIVSRAADNEIALQLNWYEHTGLGLHTTS